VKLGFASGNGCMRANPAMMPVTTLLILRFSNWLRHYPIAFAGSVSLLSNKSSGRWSQTLQRMLSISPLAWWLMMWLLKFIQGHSSIRNVADGKAVTADVSKSGH